MSQIESKPACHFSFQYQLWVISFNFPSCICRLFFWRTSELMLTKYYNVLLSAKILWKTKHRFLLTAIKSVSYIDNNVCKSRIMELEHTFSVIFILFLRKNPFKPPTQIDQSFLKDFFLRRVVQKLSVSEVILGAGRCQLILCNPPWDQRQRPSLNSCFYILHSQAKQHVAKITTVKWTVPKTPCLVSWDL